VRILELAREQWTGLLTLNACQFILFVSELLFAIKNDSLALHAHAFHCAVEWLQTATKVLTAALLNKPPTEKFSYGFRRCPILFEFAGAGLIVIWASSTCIDIVIKLYFSPPVLLDALTKDARQNSDATSTRLQALVVVLPYFAFPVINWLLVIAAGKISTRSARYSTLPSASCPESSPSLIGCGALGLEMKGNILVIAAAVLTVSGGLLAFTGWALIDSIAGFFMVVLIIPAVHSLVVRSAPILLQKAPAVPRAAFDKGCREVSTLEGVVQCSNEHFWMNAPGFHVGTLTVSLRSTADKGEILKNIQARFASSVTDLTVQFEDYEEVPFAPTKQIVPVTPDSRPQWRSRGDLEAPTIQIVTANDQHTHAA